MDCLCQTLEFIKCMKTDKRKEYVCMSRKSENVRVNEGKKQECRRRIYKTASVSSAAHCKLSLSPPTEICLSFNMPVLFALLWVRMLSVHFWMLIAGNTKRLSCAVGRSKSSESASFIATDDNTTGIALSSSKCVFFFSFSECLFMYHSRWLKSFLKINHLQHRCVGWQSM